MKRRWPAADITWVSEPMPSSILEHHPAIDRIVRYRRREGRRGVMALLRELGAVRRSLGGFDLTINCNVYFKSVWPVLFSHGRRRLGFEKGRAKDGIWLFENDFLPRRPRAHTQDMFLEFLSHLEVPFAPPDDPRDWAITFTDAERAAQRAFADGLTGKPLAALVVASANAAKDWRADRWAAVADGLAERGFEVALVGGPGARETSVAHEVTSLARTPIVWALGDGVRRVAYTLERCALAIAPDTGPLHIARALGTPVIGLFGHTNPWRVGPYRAYHDLWIDRYTEPGAAPDPSSFDPPPDDRMAMISASDVLEKVDVAIARYGVLGSDSGV